MPFVDQLYCHCCVALSSVKVAPDVGERVYTVSSTGAVIALFIWGGASLLGTLITPALDKSDSGVAWFFSFLIKWIQSPILTTGGLIAAFVVWARGGNVDFHRGMLFIEVGSGYGALTLGGVAWTLEDGFNPDGSVKDDLAVHEAYHSRQVVALGVFGRVMRSIDAALMTKMLDA